MDHTTPIRSRSHFQKLDPHTPTPTRQTSWESSSLHPLGLRKSDSFPLAGGKYSSFRSVGLESPEVFSPSNFSPKRPSNWGFSYGRHQISRLFRACSLRRLIVLLITIIFIYWW